MLSRAKILELLADWYEAWNDHDLDRVLALFHDDVIFENWTLGRAEGKDALRDSWEPWFSDNGGFVFREEETFVDEVAQKVAFAWELTWPTGEGDGMEVRRGVDLMQFADGRIISKITYSKTTVTLDGERVRLVPERSQTT